MKTYEFFTPEYSTVIQNDNIQQALVDFKLRYGHTDIIAVVEVERGQEFIGNPISVKRDPKWDEIQKAIENLAPPPPPAPPGRRLSDKPKK